MDTGSQGSMTMTGTGTLSQSHAYSVLCVHDYKRAKQFYQNMLGLQVQDAPQMGDSGFVMTGDGTGFEVYTNPNLPAPQNTTLAFLTKDFDKTFSELKSRGVKFEDYNLPDMQIKTVNGVSEMGGIKSAWFKDTEGNIFNLITDFMAGM